MVKLYSCSFGLLCPGDAGFSLIRASGMDFLGCLLDLGFRHLGFDSKRADFTREKAESCCVRIEV